jgi:glycosyltransferase involved in cell wall biosynthesis
MKLSVVIPCYNAQRFLPTQLEALASQQWPEWWELIISDNGSTDGTPTVLEEYRSRFPRLRMVDASDRRGAAHARNIGALAADGEAVAFCDADDQVMPGWLIAMSTALNHHDFVAGPLAFDKFTPPWRRMRHAQRERLNKFRYPPFLPHAGSGNMGVKRKIHLEVGGFEESMSSLEDTDYCFKIQLAGTPLHFVPEAILQVRVDYRLRGIYRKAVSNGENHMVLYKRYWQPGMPKLSWRKDVLRGWLLMAKRIRSLRSRGGRASTAWELGWRIGQLKGYYGHRVWDT